MHNEIQITYCIDKKNLNTYLQKYIFKQNSCSKMQKNFQLKLVQCFFILTIKQYLQQYNRTFLQFDKEFKCMTSRYHQGCYYYCFNISQQVQMYANITANSKYSNYIDHINLDPLKTQYTNSSVIKDIQFWILFVAKQLDWLCLKYIIDSQVTIDFLKQYRMQLFQPCSSKSIVFKYAQMHLITEPCQQGTTPNCVDYKIVQNYSACQYLV
eukprot:EC097453.1.p1 GENE.EC097453.1~~EC097453.1.p1  ORF type:complete len:211 (+),score=-5.63 EC097453.1:47-679(+)